LSFQAPRSLVSRSSADRLRWRGSTAAESASRARAIRELTQCGGCLLVAQLAPHDQQQRITILTRQPPQLANELCAQGAIFVLDQLRGGGRKTLQRFQASLLRSTMIGDDVIGDAEQPWQRAGLLSAAPISSSEGAGEHLRAEVIARL
jgi:hypothetical protein